MKTRVFYTQFWDDEYIHNCTHKEKLGFNFLLTNSKVNISGMYEMPDHLAIYCLDLKPAEWDKMKDKFTNDGKFYFFNGWVKIINAEKYQTYTGIFNDKAKAKEMQLAPKELVDYQYSIDRVLIPYAKGSDTARNKKQEIINKKQETSNKKDNSTNIDISTVAKDVIGKFNIVYSKTLTAYEPIIANLEYWLGSYTKEDIFKAIENAYASKFWRKIIDHPITLLRRKNPSGENVDYIGRLKDLAPEDEEVYATATDGKVFYTKEDLDTALNNGSYHYRKDDITGKTIIFKKIVTT